jgi:hypothetical protein
LSNNVAYFQGGGACESVLNNCTLSGNSAAGGGGAYNSWLTNCALIGNSAQGSGGAAFGGALINCTVTANSATWGGGAASSQLTNCIVYFNSAGDGANYDWCTLSYCCATPLPAGPGNISADPLLADSWHLRAGSPCRGTGNAVSATGVDLDGEPWANPPSIGCDEYYPGDTTGPLSVSIAAAWTNIVVGYADTLVPRIDGHATLCVWDFGDGTTLTNEPYAAHAWSVLGDYGVTLTVYNDSVPGGVSAFLTVHVGPGLYYVAAGNPNPLAPYTSWATAATNIQDAVDVAATGGTIVVTNGTYAAGGRPVGANLPGNRVAVDKPLALLSANGPASTIIDGRGFRCLYLAVGATLSGFTLTNGFADVGGGVWCALPSVVVSNCLIGGCLASFEGGGAYGGTLYNCTLISNQVGSATFSEVTWEYDVLFDIGRFFETYAYGGGAAGSTLNNCTLIGNSAAVFVRVYVPDDLIAYWNFSYVNIGAYGGGVAGGTLNNCTLIDNAASFDAFATDFGVFYQELGGSGNGESGCTLNNCIVDNYDDGCTLNYCWTNGDPLFVDLAGGNLRLQSNSPCINAGNNDYVTTATDLDGNPRILDGTVDIGAYEFTTPELLIGYLVDLVNQSSLSAKQPLLADLEAALASVRRGNAVSTVNQLQAFQKKVQRQVEPMDPALAAVLTQLAEETIGALSGGNINRKG